MIQKTDIPQNAIKYSRTENKIAFSEKRKNYIAENVSKKNILGFRVDNGLITSSDIRKCDYAFIVDSDLCYLVELKGHGINEACKQISKTIEYFTDNFQMQKFVGRIVISHFNTQKINDENYRKLQRTLKLIKKNFNIKQDELLIKENKLLEKI